LHTGQVERSLPEIPFYGYGQTAVAVEVAVPFAVFRVGKAVIGPLMDLAVPVLVLGVAGHVRGEEGGDDGFIVGPPELHVVPVFLDGAVLQIDEVHETAVFRIPSTSPHPIEDGAAGFDEGAVATA